MSMEESEPLVRSEDKPTSADYTSLLGGKKAPKYTQRTVIGEIRNWKRFSWLEWAFVVVATVSILGILGITVERLVSSKHNFRNITRNVSDNGSNETVASYQCHKWTCTNDFIFAVVVIVNLVFCSVYAVDGLLREKMFKMIGYAAALAVIMIYVIVNYTIKTNELKSPYRLTRVILVLVGGPINIFLSCLISYRMGFYIFSIVGSNDRLIRAYKIRSAFLTFQFFLLQVTANILLLLLAADGQFTNTAEMVIVSLLLALSLLIIPLGWAAVAFENVWLMCSWYLTLAPYYSFFVYKIVNVSVHFDTYNTALILELTSGSEKISYIYVGISTIVACVIGLAVLALLYTLMAFSHRNFKKGLREKVPPPLTGKLYLRVHHEQSPEESHGNDASDYSVDVSSTIP